MELIANMVTVMASEILRFINAITADRTRDNQDTHGMYSSMKEIDMHRLSVTFGLHNAMTQTIVYKTYDLYTFARICSDSSAIEITFNELTEYMLTKSNEFKNKTIVLNDN